MSSKRVTTFARLVLVVFSAVAFASGCSLAAPSAPSTSTPNRTTESFEGSFTYQNSKSHAFTVTEPGLVEVNLTSVGPLTTMAIGVAVGTWANDTCTNLNIRNTAARTGSAALSGTAAAGSYCVNLFDSGNLPSNWTVTYTVSVTHP